MGHRSDEDGNRITGAGFSQGPTASCATLGQPLKTSLRNVPFVRWGDGSVSLLGLLGRAKGVMRVKGPMQWLAQSTCLLRISPNSSPGCESLHSCVTLGKPLNLSEPFLSNGNSNTYPRGFVPLFSKCLSQTFYRSCTLLSIGDTVTSRTKSMVLCC